MWKNFKTKSTTIQKNDLDHFVVNQPALADYVDIYQLGKDLDTVLSNICIVYFGIREGLIPDEIIEQTSAEIVKRFKGLRIADINYAFERANIEKPDTWRNITKVELIEPIEKWANYKEKIRQEFQKYQKELENEKEHERLKQEFYEESKKLYNDCVDSLEWTGTIFQASVIFKEVGKGWPQEEKDAIWAEAQKKKAEQDQEKQDTKRGGKLSIDNFGYSAIRLCAEMVVIEGIKRGVKI